MADRYEAVGPEAEFQPGSRGRVLRNLISVDSVREMARVESVALLKATQTLIDETRTDQRFTAADICRMHRVWLDGIYSWAGAYRTVNIAKGQFMFAAAIHVPKLMAELERGALRQYTPCMVTAPADQARALAEVHTELILIHPFREGNGRCSRLLAVLMGLQAGLPPLDFGGIRGAEKRRYINAVYAGLDRNYEPMSEIFRKVIARTLRAVRRA